MIIHVSVELTFSDSELIFGSAVWLQVTLKAGLQLREATAVLAADTLDDVVSIMTVPKLVMKS